MFVLSNFKEANIQIGDKAYYVLTPEDVEGSNIPRENSKEKRLKSDNGAMNKGMEKFCYLLHYLLLLLH